MHATSAAFSKALVFSFFWKLSIFVPECRPPGIADVVGGCSCFQIRIRIVFFLALRILLWLILIIDYPGVRHPGLPTLTGCSDSHLGNFEGLSRVCLDPQG